MQCFLGKPSVCSVQLTFGPSRLVSMMHIMTTTKREEYRSYHLLRTFVKA